MFIKKSAAALVATFAAMFAIIGKLFDRYFGNGFRAKEFAVWVAAAFAAGLWLGTQLLLSPVRARIVGYVLGGVTGVAYIRNPRKRQWKESPDEILPIPGRASGKEKRADVDVPEPLGEAELQVSESQVSEGKPYA